MIQTIPELGDVHDNEALVVLIAETVTMATSNRWDLVHIRSRREEEDSFDAQWKLRPVTIDRRHKTLLPTRVLEIGPTILPLGPKEIVEF